MLTSAAQGSEEGNGLVGASEWDYYVPYQEDLSAALQQLRREVFDAGGYYWVNGADWRPEEEREPRPRTLEELCVRLLSVVP